METELTQECQQAHALLDSLGPDQLAAVARLLEVMADPVTRSIANAPVEDEEITPQMAVDLDRAASIERGEGIPHEEIMQEFGLTPRA